MILMEGTPLPDSRFRRKMGKGVGLGERSKHKYNGQLPGLPEELL